MISKKTLVIACFVITIIYHFIFYFEYYGPSYNEKIDNYNSVLAFISSLILIFLYFGTNWRAELKSKSVIVLFNLLILSIFINYFRSLLGIHGILELRPLLFDQYIGLSMFPVLFFIAGINIRYFSPFNKILSVYCVLAWVFSLFFLNHFEFQFFLLIPIFYIIVTFPIQSYGKRVLTLIISLCVIFFSSTNRAGELRILMSYSIVIICYVITSTRINKKIINFLIFCLLLSPAYFIYMGVNGKSIFQVVLGDDTEEFSQQNYKADTRTVLYFEVLQDMKTNNAFVFGKGINAGYTSDIFQTLDRKMAEVGFLQILLKSGIIGFLLYITVIFSAIFKALGKSKSMYMKFLGLLLSGYVLMFFIENVVAFSLFNAIIWFVVGMCHSDELLGLNDQEIRKLL